LKGASHWTQSNHCWLLNKFRCSLRNAILQLNNSPKNFDYWLLLIRRHFGNHLAIALKAKAWTCEITTKSPKGLNHAHWMNLLNMNLVRLKSWFSRFKPLFNMYTSHQTPYPRIQWQYIVARSKKRQWYLHCKNWEETTIPML
jgi:hypothetical protein